MNIHRWLVIPCLILLLVGCSGDPIQAPEKDAPTSVTVELPDQIEETLDRQADGLAAGLPALMDGEGPNNSATAGYDVYVLVYLWGRLANATDTPEQTTDWTGMLTMTAVGHMAPLTGIFFEEGQDSLVPTNANIHVAWVSFTENDFDGVAALMFTDPSAVYVTPPTLDFNTAPLQLQLPIDQLDLFYGFFPVDNVNAVAVHTRRIFTNSCPGGYLDGEWVRDDVSGLTGTLSGLWLDHNGDPTGIFSALFWTSNDGTRSFSGQLSGYQTDQVIAEIFGVWAYDDPRLCPLCGSSHGWLKGRYLNLDGSGGGSIRAMFGDYNQPPEENLLPLSGTWRQDCPGLSTGTPTSGMK